ncbi:MAG: PQQ-dependent sugar dehydrogenase [Verrucomicrobia bacterium]|nr:PQQ-dependent sugar dehydrogenase [Verrucomicrobiota bacterium]MBI3868477.1 PQQ-dependent sugar dehydrogenase [Verrucomicrobiota bacterium]
MRSASVVSLAARWLAVFSLALGISWRWEAYGALARASASGLRFPQTPRFPGYQLSNVFENLAFTAPVAVVSPPGETNRLFVAERVGRVLVISNLAMPTKTLFLDLQGRTAQYNIESGLLGLAFHPGFATNGYFFVFRTALMPTIGYADVLTRYQVAKSSPNQVDIASETVVFAISDPSDEHNAGDLQFGPDGYLYVAMGDAGPFLASQANKQPIDEGLGAGILRLDVDNRFGSLPPNPLTGATLNYRVPPDNPFVGAQAYQGLALAPNKVRTEFFAVGLRNPWRMSFDRTTGRLFCGDVGSDQREEVNVVQKGANFGWPYFEGSLAMTPKPASIPGDFVFTPPVTSYGHGAKSDQGEAVVGGLVYRGARIAQLVGKYLFADNVRGHVWSLDYDPAAGTNQPFVRITGEPGISAFGVDPRDQEVLVANHLSGAILKLVYVPPEQASFPPTLADTGVFKDLSNLTPSAGMIGYDLNAPFWSDFALKTRWFGLIGLDNAIQFSPSGNWGFPTGAVWIKHFEMEMTNGVPASRRRLETRFVVKNAQGFYAGTYKWDANQANASLVPDQGLDELLIVRDGTLTRTQTWRYPSRAECSACHTAAGGYALGFRSTQLNRAHDYAGLSENQITALSNAGYFTQPVTDDLGSLRVLVAATNLDYPVEYRARSYLAANCSQCHQPGSRATLDVFWDGRFETPLAQTALIGNYVQPGDPAGSRILQKISTLVDMMPPVGSSVLNTNGINLMLEWISGYPQAPWTNTDIGAVQLPGSATISGGQLSVSGAGRDIWGQGDEFQFLYQGATNNLQLKARFVSQRGGSLLTKAGVMIRQSEAPDSSHAMVSRLGDGTLGFQRRVAKGASAKSSLVSGPDGPQWLKLTREGDLVRSMTSGDGTNWIDMGRDTIPMSPRVLVGLASSSRDPRSYNTAAFDSVELITADWAEPEDELTLSPPSRVTLSVDVPLGADFVRKVTFFAGTNRIVDVMGEPFEYPWVNRLAGDYQLVARITDWSGSEFFTPTRNIHFTEAASGAQAETVDNLTKGAWKAGYGREGAVVVGDSTNLPASVVWGVSQVFNVVWQAPSSDPRALSRASGTGAVAAAWVAPGEIDIDLALRDNAWHRVGFYCVDFDRAGRRQTLELRDAATGRLLASRDLTGFQDGVYVSWAARGHLNARITSGTAAGAVLSGLFIDASPNKPPSVVVVHPTQNQSFELPEEVVIDVATSDPDGVVRQVEFFANDVSLGVVTAPPYRWVWQNPLIGEYEIVARATDNFGEVVDSRPVDIELESPPGLALFLGTDDATQGRWRAHYGADGYDIPALATALPNYLGLSRSTSRTFIWQEPTSDPRAVQHVRDSLGIAACWVDGTGFTTHLSFADGQKHVLSGYFVDWDSVTRKEKIALYDDHSNALLDVRSLSDFHAGDVLSWLMQGRIRMEVTALQGNAVLSALLFDPEAAAQPNIRNISVGRAGDRLQITLSWLSVPNRNYRIQVATNIADGAWSDVDSVVGSTTFEARRILDVAPDQPRLFFRILAVP